MSQEGLEYADEEMTLLKYLLKLSEDRNKILGEMLMHSRKHRKRNED